MDTEDLVGIGEVRQLLSLSRQRADILSRSKGFPDPVLKLASGRVWNRADVLAWAKETGRK